MRPWTLCLLSLLLLPAAAVADFGWQLVRGRVNPKQGERSEVVVEFQSDLERARATIVATSGGSFERTWTWDKPRAGQSQTLTWDGPDGLVNYELTVVYEDDWGESDPVVSQFEIATAAPISASIPEAGVDLDAKQFDLVTNQPPAFVELEVFDANMQLLGKSTFPVQGAVAGKPVRVTWIQDKAGDVFKIHAKAHDPWGTWAAVDIIPWSLQIPHEDVVFETGKHDIPPVEAPKVDEAWAQIERALKKYGDLVDCVLWVGGYTDTVGSATANQQLSEQRALSLARAFRERGASVPIRYQGFGEYALAVPTPDSTDEAANRRAVYLITAGNTPAGRDTPRRDWKSLR